MKTIATYKTDNAKPFMKSRNCEHCGEERTEAYFSNPRKPWTCDICLAKIMCVSCSELRTESDLFCSKCRERIERSKNSPGGRVLYIYKYLPEAVKPFALSQVKKWASDVCELSDTNAEALASSHWFFEDGTIFIIH